MNAWLYLYFPDMRLHSLVHDYHSPVIVIPRIGNGSFRYQRLWLWVAQRPRRCVVSVSGIVVIPEPGIPGQLLQQGIVGISLLCTDISGPADGLWLEAGSMPGCLVAFKPC